MLRRGKKTTSSISIFSRISVRLRIALISLVTVIGLSVIAVVYWSGQANVGAAFENHKLFAKLAQLTRELKAQTLQLRLLQKEFAVRPSSIVIRHYDESTAEVEASLKELWARVSGGVGVDATGAAQAAAPSGWLQDKAKELEPILAAKKAEQDAARAEANQQPDQAAGEQQDQGAGENDTAAAAPMDEAELEAKQEDGVANLIVTIARIDGQVREVFGLQEQMGFADDSGLIGKLQESEKVIDKRLKKELKENNNSEVERLARLFLELQNAELGVRLNGLDVFSGKFEVAFGRFERFLQKAYLPKEVKQELSDALLVYRTSFDGWTKALGEQQSLAEKVRNEFDVLTPSVSSLQALARTGEVAAQSELETARSNTTRLMILVISVVFLLGMLLSIIVGLSISSPLARLRNAMEHLAEGQTDIDLKDAAGRDEVAAMARTVSVFRDNAIERERLSQERMQESEAREQRAQVIEQRIHAFEASVNEALDAVREAAGRLSKSSAELNQASEQASTQTEVAETAVSRTTENVSSAASATEQLAASVSEIAQQAANSTTVAGRAMEQAQETSQTMRSLAEVAGRIGEVVQLIRAIADKTNLLALNATIEAARAGEAGRGFAIVANEVKSLANQTAKATEDIAEQVGAIQNVSSDAVMSIDQVNDVISEMAKMAAAVAAAVEEQNSAVAGIAGNVQDAAGQSAETASAIGDVRTTTSGAQRAAEDVDQLAGVLTEQAETLEGQIKSFLSQVRAA